jgi:hypothetical protein
VVVLVDRPLVARANPMPLIVPKVVVDPMRNFDGKWDGRDRRNKRRSSLSFYQTLVNQLALLFHIA